MEIVELYELVRFYRDNNVTLLNSFPLHDDVDPTSLVRHPQPTSVPPKQRLTWSGTSSWNMYELNKLGSVFSVVIDLI